MTTHGPRWLRDNDGYQSRLGQLISNWWWDVVYIKQEICFRVLGRCHFRRY